ncbi:hypothetical protein Nepgr_021952 [Nepenthes gracilis]|uniref:ENT domain-containing protein n=1 Tax=Nepenthes gracilis TaxID=150966 RepID=A0AAD3SZV7_NEPGR|nr:hypothetical protein Nepgr_021952 [Nepenthes gracilis]
MEYEQSLSDHTDTDDELPPYHNRVHKRAHISGNGNPGLGAGPPVKIHRDMETQIHHLEKEAYFSVLRAFKAQADAITWDKEGLITELRKELRVSDDEHRELLGRVNNDDVICRIREWRQAVGSQAPMLGTSHPVHDVLPSPTLSASRKKQRTLQQPPSVRLPSAVYPHSVATSIQPSPSFGALGSRGRKSKQIPRDDIQWVGEDPGISHQSGHDDEKLMILGGPVSGAGKTHQKKELQNGIADMATDDIEILHTATLIKEVEKVVAASHPDRLEIEKAKKMLKEHEQALIDAISRLSYVSDGEIDGDQQS